MRGAFRLGLGLLDRRSNLVQLGPDITLRLSARLARQGAVSDVSRQLDHADRLPIDIQNRIIGRLQPERITGFLESLEFTALELTLT